MNDHPFLSHNYYFKISVPYSANTVMTDIGFDSLKTISNGDVILVEFGKACPLKTLNWAQIVKHPTEFNKKFPEKYRNGVYIKDNASSVRIAQDPATLSLLFLMIIIMITIIIIISLL